MTYVPVPPTVTPQPSSPRTRELASLLTKVVDEYRGAHPSVSGKEIREALRMTQVTAGGSKAPVAVAVSLALGLLVMGLTLGLVFLGRGGGIELGDGTSMPMIVLAITVFLGIVVAAIKVANR